MVWWCFVTWIITCTTVHEVNESFYWFFIKEDTVEVEVEFPWTIRNALIQFNPLLEQATSKKEFEDTFVNYITENFTLSDKNGTIFPLKGYKVLDKKGHAHQNNYLLIFKGKNLFKVTNTIMFTLHDNQLNYHKIIVNSSIKTFQTEPDHACFLIGEEKKYAIFYIVLCGMLVLYLVYLWFYKRSTVFQQK